MKKPLSYSGIGTYEKCPRKFQYHYIDAVEVANPPTEETAPAMFRGTRLHAELEDFLNDEIQELSPELESHLEFAQKIKGEGAKAETQYCLTNDWEFQDWDSPEGLLRGMIDVELVYMDGPVGYIWDWKTGKVYPEHAGQRALYALFLLLKYPHLEEVVSASYYLDQNKAPQETYKRSRLEAYKWVWKNKAAKTRPPQEYPMRPSWQCRFCDFSKERGGPCSN